MKTLRKTLSIILAFLMVAQFCACGGVSSGNAPITSRWKVTTIDNNGTVTDMTGWWAVWDTVSGAKVPEFTSDGSNFTFSMSGKDHNGYVVQNGDVYELYWDNTNNPNSPAMSTATITGNIMEIELKPGIKIIFSTK